MSNDTQTLTLTEFLLARMAEDEADVAATTHPDQQFGTPWHWRSRARVLAQCAAHRRIVERLTCPEAPDCGDHDCMTIDEDRRLLASVYADHPGWRDEWKL